MEKKGYEDYDGWANEDLNDVKNDQLLKHANKDLPENTNGAIVNNLNDLVETQGSTGIYNINFGKRVKEVEQEYQRRSENPDRDEENPIYNDGDQTIK